MVQTSRGAAPCEWWVVSDEAMESMNLSKLRQPDCLVSKLKLTSSSPSFDVRKVCSYFLELLAGAEIFIKYHDTLGVRRLLYIHMLYVNVLFQKTIFLKFSRGL